MQQRKTLWMNHHELNREEIRAIRSTLFGSGKVFDALSIAKDAIPAAQQFEWPIMGAVYEEFGNLPVSQYITSPQFVYYVAAGSDGYRIPFHFRFYSQYSAEDPQCAIYLEIDEIPRKVERIRIEVDMKCIKKRQFRQLLRTRVLSSEQRITGFVTFHHREIAENESMKWMFAMKILDAEEADVDEGEEYLQDLYQIFEYDDI